jgi:2-iminobutanoate/2-iminopropanoate deaminase
MRRIRLAGQLAEPISHYTDGVTAGGLVFVSGMLPVDADGGLVGAGDVIRQAEQVLDNVGLVLRAAGAGFGDVVKVSVFLLDMADREAINTVRRRFFGDARPASTLVQVSALALAGARVEIEAVAMLPPDPVALPVLLSFLAFLPAQTHAVVPGESHPRRCGYAVRLHQQIRIYRY